MRKIICGGNWKMQIPHVSEGEKIALNLASEITSLPPGVEVFIAPSFNSLYVIGRKIEETNLKLAGQNMHYLEKGAFTGQTSILSLIEAKCSYVILGHSEPRRIFGESSQIINLKVKLAIKKGLRPVLCIGETAKEREEGLTAKINELQLTESLKGISAVDMTNVIIAYEPVWAINNEFLNPGIEIKPATPRQASEAHKLIRNWIETQYGDEIANNIPIIYGGSMNSKNAKELLHLEDIDGGLIGGASLTGETFLPIIRIAESIV